MTIQGDNAIAAGKVWSASVYAGRRRIWGSRGAAPGCLAHAANGILYFGVAVVVLTLPLFYFASETTQWWIDLFRYIWNPNGVT